MSLTSHRTFLSLLCKETWSAHVRRKQTFAGIVYAHLFCACNACDQAPLPLPPFLPSLLPFSFVGGEGEGGLIAGYFHHTWVVFLPHSIANTLINAIFFSRSTQNHEKHEHIAHIMGYIMFRHRKLVVTPIFLLIELNFVTASSFQWLKGFHFSPKVNEADNGYNDTAYLRNPNFFLHFWNKVPKI